MRGVVEHFHVLAPDHMVDRMRCPETRKSTESTEATFSNCTMPGKLTLLTLRTFLTLGIAASAISAKTKTAAVENFSQ